MVKPLTPAADTSSENPICAPGAEVVGTHEGCAGWEIQNYGSMDAYLQSDVFPIRCNVHGCDAWECFEDSNTVVGQKVEWKNLPDDYVSWGCPQCGMNHSGEHHFQEQADACRYKSHSTTCGFFCDCDVLPPERDKDAREHHGCLISNPCPNAHCNHCDWSGTFPEPPEVHVPLSAAERARSIRGMAGDQLYGLVERYEATVTHRDELLTRAKDLIEKLWDLAEQADDEDVHPDEDCPRDDTCDCPLPNLLNDVHRAIRETLSNG